MKHVFFWWDFELLGTARVQKESRQRPDNGGHMDQVQKALKDVFTASHGDDKRPSMLSSLLAN